jgi:hypothetical protein
MKPRPPYPTDETVGNYLLTQGYQYKAVSLGVTHRFGRPSDGWRLSLTKGNRELVCEHFSNGIGNRVITNLPINTQANIKQSKAWMGAEKPYRLLGDVMTKDRLRSREWTVTPTVANFLYCILSDARLAEEGHLGFCESLGIDTDSRKGLEDFLACDKTRHDVDRFFPSDHRQHLEKLLEDY